MGKRNATNPGQAIVAAPSPFETAAGRDALVAAMKPRLDELTRQLCPGVAMFKELVSSPTSLQRLERLKRNVCNADVVELTESIELLYYAEAVVAANAKAAR